MTHIATLRAVLAQAKTDRAALVLAGAPTHWIDRLIEQHENDLIALDAPSEEAHGHGMFPDWDSIDVVVAIGAVLGVALVLYRWLA